MAASSGSSHRRSLPAPVSALRVFTLDIKRKWARLDRGRDSQGTGARKIGRCAPPEATSIRKLRVFAPETGKCAANNFTSVSFLRGFDSTTPGASPGRFGSPRRRRGALGRAAGRGGGAGRRSELALDPTRAGTGSDKRDKTQRHNRKRKTDATATNRPSKRGCHRAR